MKKAAADKNFRRTEGPPVVFLQEEVESLSEISGRRRVAAFPVGVVAEPPRTLSGGGGSTPQVARAPVGASSDLRGVAEDAWRKRSGGVAGGRLTYLPCGDLTQPWRSPPVAEEESSGSGGSEVSGATDVAAPFCSGGRSADPPMLWRSDMIGRWHEFRFVRLHNFNQLQHRHIDTRLHKICNTSRPKRQQKKVHQPSYSNKQAVYGSRGGSETF